MGTGPAQSSLLNCFPSHLGHVDPFHICQRQLPMAFPCVSITATTPVAATNTRTHTSIIALDPPPFVPAWPGPSPESVCHTSREVEVQRIRVRWITLPLFASPLSYYPHISQTNFPKLSRFLQQLKHFSHSRFLSSLSFWQEARPCWSGRLSVPGPKLTQPIGGGGRDLTNKRNRGLRQGGRLGFEEQRESHRACHCFSTTDRFWQLSGLFFPKPKEPSCSGKPS